MTLTTRIEIFDRDADPEALFGALREAVGIPPDQGQRIYRFNDDEITVVSVPGGFPAGVVMTLRPSAPEPHWDQDEWDSGWSVSLSLNTAGAQRGDFEHHLHYLSEMLGKVKVHHTHWRIFDENHGHWLQKIGVELVPVSTVEEERL